ncbi:MAG: oligoendopeptidase F [Oscillospiraceae bacterium]|nr:oligoendopeptidase F [Oscillospiraceae bacterium]
MERSEQQTAYTWAIEDLFPSDEAWQSALERAKGFLPRVKALEGHLGESAETLLASMKLEDEMSVALMDLIEYAARKGDEDTRVAKYQDMMAQLTALLVEINTAGSYEDNEILAISDEALERWYADTPDLALYRRKLEQVRRRRAHILSPAEETLLASAGELSEGPDTIFSMLNDADMTFPDAIDSEGTAHPVTHGSYIPLMYSQDRTLRKSAFESLYSVYRQFRNTSAAVLSAQAKQLLFFSRARKYSSALAAALDRNEVPVEVYHNLISAVRANLPKLHRYTALRKKLLGVDELHFYDLYTPIVGDVDMTVPFEEGKRLVEEALAPMGEDYLRILREGFENRWIDVYENAGKRSGAYSAGARVHPFVLLNYHDTLNDVFTLAHEMGHAIHSYHSNKYQPVAYADYVIFVAEVASTCNEALLMEHLLRKTTDRRERAYLINYFLEQFRTTLYRQTMFAEFELKINEMAQRGEGLTADALCDLYRQLNVDYFGPDIVVDDEIALEWARIPHFFYDFYVYQYATGYSAAIALSRRILKEGEQAVKDYVKFLSGGCSADPIALLRGAGVDMATPQPVNEALELFDRLLDEMEELMPQR